MNRLASSLIACAIACVGPLYIMAAGASTETVLYSFQGSPSDGAFPFAGLIDVNGTLYGTTADGGGANCYDGVGCGTVFSFDPQTGAEKVVYSFCSRPNCVDGAHPEAGLLALKGTLYGTTTEGGADCESNEDSGCGTVFALNPKTGTETVLHSFDDDSADGTWPGDSLIELDGMLYGTTGTGGAYSYGTVFSVDPETGAETVVYSFCGQQNCPDGLDPQGGVIDVKGMLYGTTMNGGLQGAGTVFALDPQTGTEKVVYSFCSQQNCADGLEPEFGLIDVKGTLYGTTFTGGRGPGCMEHEDGCGTVFSVDATNGAEKVIYSFSAATDSSNATHGDGPAARVVYVKGTLYGITYYGGTGPCTYAGIGGCGTVFSLDPKTGAAKILYSFCSQHNCADGQYPRASLINMNGTLYGTTSDGGTGMGTGCAAYNGCGTLFSLKP